jgi:hypothetical protein
MKSIGAILLVVSTSLSQFLVRIFVALFKCTASATVTCGSILQQISFYSAIISFVFMIFLICYFTLFITKQFPDSKIPYSCWHERNSLIRNLWKLTV